MSTVTEPALGAQSEVGTLRTVLVHRPDLAHERLSPSNCHELLFDDVIWVRRARQEFDAFVDLMRERGVEVLLLHDLLAETLADPARASGCCPGGCVRRRSRSMFARPLTEWMSEMPADELATRLTGGVTVRRAARRDALDDRPGACGRPTSCCAPLPNQLFTRDTSAWIYGGVSINPMFWPARQHETLNVEAIYRFHPRFRDADFPIWFGGVDHDWGGASHRRRRHHAGRRRRRPRRPGRAQHGAGRQHPRAEPVRGRRGPARDRGADAARARCDAPRHRLHLLRPRRRDDLRAGRVADPADPLPAGRQRRRAAPSSRSARSSRRCRTRSGSPS